mmetsp:Transcript_66168/g.158268  ORF Transcript_66168/g.158268 Transcript_66168/m.158268 type:complete len:433 (+) Transcript_66168:233-1531(+)
MRQIVASSPATAMEEPTPTNDLSPLCGGPTTASTAEALPFPGKSSVDAAAAQSVSRKRLHTESHDEACCSPEAPAKTHCRKTGLSALGQPRTMKSDRREERFLAELHMLLRRLTPPKRRAVLQTCLEPGQRHGLETWMRLQESNVTRSLASTDKRKATSQRSRTVPPAKGSESQRKGVVTVTQRSKVTGCASQWFFAVGCAGDLQIVARQRWTRAEALADHAIIHNAKQCIAARTACGTPFDEAARAVLAKLSADSQPRQPKAGQAALYPEKLFLRFHIGICFGSSYKTMVRSPVFHDIDHALAARSRLRSAMGCDPLLPSRISTDLSFRECTEVLARVRKEHCSMHREVRATDRGETSIEDVTTGVEARFRIVEERVHAARDDRNLARLARLLGPKAAAKIRLVQSQCSVQSASPGEQIRACKQRREVMLV